MRDGRAGSGAPQRCGSRELIRFPAAILHSNEFLLLETCGCRRTLTVSQNIDGTFDPSASVARLPGCRRRLTWARMTPTAWHAYATTGDGDQE